jgi:hypothetical protein
MPANGEPVICVLHGWDGWRTAQVRLDDVESIHWAQPDRAPRPLLHAYISCASIVTGVIPHDCERTSAPHRLLVCILRKHCAPSAYAELERRIGR